MLTEWGGLVGVPMLSHRLSRVVRDRPRADTTGFLGERFPGGELDVPNQVQNRRLIKISSKFLKFRVKQETAAGRQLSAGVLSPGPPRSPK